MLANRDACANLAVKDLRVAKQFYAQTLGLKEVPGDDAEVLTFESGNTRLNVYRSEYAGTNKATAVTWAVDDVPAEVKELKTRGVSFEHYDMPDLQREGDVYVGGEMKVAWFKDPDGNILNLVNR
jgi:predicted enzyme related to lactoylglutathione lyase